MRALIPWKAFGSKLIPFLSLLALGFGFVDCATAQTDSSTLASDPTTSDAGRQAQATVEAYVRDLLPPPRVLNFLSWTNFTNSGPSTSITLQYKVQKPYGQPAVATVQFTIQDGKVIKTQIVQNPQPATLSLSSTPTPTPEQRDRFSGSLAAAKNAGGMTLSTHSAYSLSELDKAKAQAQADKKPIGFIIVWGNFFGEAPDTREHGGNTALLHYYEAFRDHLILVFVRHETELTSVPDAVKKGFFSPEEGGWAPSMAVTDATVSEFIVQIPSRNLDGPGRDKLFAAGAKKIDQWLDTHPDAVTLPPAK